MKGPQYVTEACPFPWPSSHSTPAQHPPKTELRSPPPILPTTPQLPFLDGSPSLVTNSHFSLSTVLSNPTPVGAAVHEDGPPYLFPFGHNPDLASR